MKHLPVFLALLITTSFSLFAQTPGTVRYNNRVVWVYPYRTETYSLSSDRHQLNIYLNMDVPYYPKPLPDGEYIVYYTVQRYLEGHYASVVKPGDTDNVAIHFTLRDGKKNGAAEFFTDNYKHKSVYFKGFYKDDRKDSLWSFKNEKITLTCNYKNDLLHGPVRRVEAGKQQWVYNYSNGELDGEATLTQFKTGAKEVLHYSHGLLHGSYTCTLKNSLLKNRFFNPFPSDVGPRFKYCEIQGQFSNNIRYGEWRIKNEKTTLEIFYDTTAAEPLTQAGENEAEYMEEELSEDPSMIFSSRPERQITVPKAWDQKRFPCDDMADGYAMWLQDGYGYFRFSLTTGRELARDSFCFGKLISADTLYSFKGERQGIITSEEPLNGHASYRKVAFDESDALGQRYLWADSLWVEVERTTTSKKPDYTNFRCIRTEKYYFLTCDMFPENILVDSSVYIFKSSGGTYINTKYLHTPTSFTYEKTFYIRDSTLQHSDSTEFYYNPELYTLTEIRRTQIDDLSFIDSVKYDSRYLHPFSKSAGFSLTANERKSSISQGGRLLPDTFEVTAYWKGIPLNGTVAFSLQQKQKALIHAEEIFDKSGFVFMNQKNIAVSYKPWDVYSYDLLNYLTHSFTLLNFKQGRLNGMVSGSDAITPPAKHRRVTGGVNFSSVSYVSGLKNGIETSENKFFYLKQKKSLWRKTNAYDFLYSYSENQRFENGRREGIQIKKRNSQLISISEMHNGQLSGETKVFDEREQPYVICNFRNDTLEGSYTCFTQNNEVKETLHFSGGLPDGLYYQYRYQPTTADMDSTLLSSVTFCKERKVNTAVISFKNGYLVNESRFYHCDGIPKAIITFYAEDSVMPVRLKRNQNDFSYEQAYATSETGSNVNETAYPYYIRYTKDISLLGLGNNEERFLFEFNTQLPGYYKLFYKSGVPSQEGRIDRKGMKTGWWKYWNENGILMKEILYEKGRIADPAKPSDSLNYSGVIQSYYPDGKPMMKGYVLDENFTYECVQDGSIAYQDICYTAFYTPDGKQVLINQTGYVKDYHISGYVREEGNLKNGQREGLWETYHSNGNLASIGTYVNGKKDGIWLSGDLSGKGFVDNQCFKGLVDMNALRGNMSEQFLNFTETIYDMGREIKTVNHSVDLSR